MRLEAIPLVNPSSFLVVVVVVVLLVGERRPASIVTFRFRLPIPSTGLGKRCREKHQMTRFQLHQKA